MLRMEDGVCRMKDKSLQFIDNKNVQFTHDTDEIYQGKGLHENGSTNRGMDKTCYSADLSCQFCNVACKDACEKKGNLQPDEQSQKIMCVNSASDQSQDDRLESQKKSMHDNQSHTNSCPFKILSASECIKMQDGDKKVVRGNERSSYKRTSQQSNISTSVQSSKTITYPVVYIKGQGWLGMNTVVQEKVIIKFPDDTSTINTAKYSASMIDKSKTPPCTSGNCISILSRCACLYFWQIY